MRRARKVIPPFAQTWSKSPSLSTLPDCTRLGICAWLYDLKFLKIMCTPPLKSWDGSRLPDPTKSYRAGLASITRPVHRHLVTLARNCRGWSGKADKQPKTSLFALRDRNLSALPADFARFGSLWQISKLLWGEVKKRKSCGWALLRNPKTPLFSENCRLFSTHDVLKASLCSHMNGGDVFEIARRWSGKPQTSKTPVLPP